MNTKLQLFFFRAAQCQFARVVKGGGLKIHWRQLRVGSSPTVDRAGKASRPSGSGRGLFFYVRAHNHVIAHHHTNLAFTKCEPILRFHRAHKSRAFFFRAAQCQFARVVKGVDLTSTGGNSAWVRAPQLTCVAMLFYF